jgi:hypothetical protein
MGHSGGTIHSIYHVTQHPERYASVFLLAMPGGSATPEPWFLQTCNDDATFNDGIRPVNGNTGAFGTPFNNNYTNIFNAGIWWHVQVSHPEGINETLSDGFSNTLIANGFNVEPEIKIPFNWHTSWAYTASGGPQPLPWHVSKFKLNPTCNGPTGLSTPHNTPLVVSSTTVTANDTDPQNLALHVSAVSSPVNGTVSLSGGNVTFTPTTGYTGAASFNYTAANTDGQSAPGTAALTVGGVSTGVTFPTVAFSASGPSSPVLRVQPDRLNDVIDVKDWGAVGDGVTDDSGPIQAAINYAWTLVDTLTGGGHTFMGGRVFIPAGVYWVDGTTIHLINPTGTGGNRALQMIGVGKNLSIIKGLNNSSHVVEAVGYIDSLILMRHMAVWNTSTVANTRALWMAGGVNIGRYDNCKFIGMNGIDYDNNGFPCTLTNCDFLCSAATNDGIHANTIAPANSTSPGPVSGTVGIQIGQWSLYNCSFTGFDIGCGMETAGGGNVTGCRAYRCNVGFNPGGFHGTGGGLQGGGLTGCLSERCKSGIRNTRSQGATHAGNVIKGQIGTDINTAVSPSSGPAEPATIASTSWLGGIVTVTTSAPHNLAAGTQKLSLALSPSSWLPPGNTDGLVSCTRLGASTFTYTGPGSSPGGSATGTWNYPMLVALESGATKGAAFFANYVDAPASGVSVQLNAGTVAYQACSIMAMNGTYGWSFPPSGISSTGNVYLAQIGADFPMIDSSGTGGVEEMIVSDGQAGIGFNGLYTGGGSTQYKVRRTGANFAVVG